MTSDVLPANDSNRSRKAAGTAARRRLSPKSLLLPYQLRFVDDPARFKIAVMSRQTGKSFCTAGEAVESCLTEPKAQWVCLSAGERQALEWMAKAREWADAYKLAIADYAEDRTAAETLLKAAEIRFSTGARIIAIPANPNTARGYSANIILDEFGYHDNPDAIWAAMFFSVVNPLAGTFSEKVRAMFAPVAAAAVQRKPMRVRVVSTFNGQQNKFYKLWEKADQAGWSKHRVTIHDAVRDGLAINIEELRAATDDPDIFAQECECVPMDTAAVLLPYDLLLPCENPQASETISPEFWLSNVRSAEPLFLGIDFGRKRDLTVCWALARLANAYNLTREVLALSKCPTQDQLELLRPRIRRAQRVCFDYSGPGIGLGDLMVKEFGEWKPDEHKYGKIELCTFTNSFKLELFPKLRLAFDQKVIGTPVSVRWREDLHSIHRQVSATGNIAYRAPHTADGHADGCTALALAVRAASNSSQGITDVSGIMFGRTTSLPQFRPAMLMGVRA